LFVYCHLISVAATWW